MTPIPPIPVSTGLSGLIADVDLLLVDVWGVLHNGLAAHPLASEALTRFRAGGGFVMLVSNAPRGGDVVVPFLDSLGVARSAYDGVITSGDVSRSLIGRGDYPTLAYIGPDKDRSIFAGLAVRETAIEDAAAVLCAGFRDDESETPDEYATLLAQCRARELPMICANPDLVVERGPKLIWCAGALAEAYERIGGRVVWTGKPHRIIYDAALDFAGAARGRPSEPARILAIGDAVRTDIAGARRLGVRSLMIADGIHALELLDEKRMIDPEKAKAFFAAASFRPDAAMARLIW